MKFSKLIGAATRLLKGGGVSFIGDVIHLPFHYEKKLNEWGGYNYKYHVLPRQFVKTINVADGAHGIVWDEIVSLSKHCGIPAYRVTLVDGYAILCSPKNSILVADFGGYRTVDLQSEDIVNMLTPCISKNGGVIREVAIKDVTPLRCKLDMWDVTLKNNTIFLADDHLFVYDTVAVHVPVTRGAIKDVFNMFPSNNLIAEQSGSLVAEPEHSAIVGLYSLSKTKEGRKRINDILPDQYDFHGPASKSDILEMLRKIALDKGPDAGKVINDIRRLGDSVAFETGLTIGVSDLSPLQSVRDEIMPDMLAEIRRLPKGEQTRDKLSSIYSKYIDKSNKAMETHFKANNSELSDIYLSKARGSLSQYRDMLVSPIAVTSSDIPGRPIKHSYIEGLTPAEYAIAAHGARLGVLGRSQGTAMPGALGKELLATANTLVVNKAEGNSMGEIKAEIGKWRPDDVIGRYLSREVVTPTGVRIANKGDLVTPKLLQKMTSSGVKDAWVYSPLQSSSADGGIPAMAYGNNHKGSLPTAGENIGAISAFAIVEPLFTGSMGSFHHGSALGAKKPAYPRVKQILELTKSIPDKAPLSEVSGRVDKITIDALGGSHIVIAGEEHYSPPRHTVTVKVGDVVKKGDQLSDGTLDPRDIADKRGLGAAQEYMVEELHKVIPNARRKAIETVVEGITRHAQIVDPGDSSYLPGDVDLIASIEKQNKDLPNKIKYDYLFKGVNYLPQDTQSWLSKFNFRNIKREFTKDVISGAEASTSSYEPAPAMAKGVTFGLGENGKY